MGDAAVEYETRAAIEGRLEQARRIHGTGIISSQVFWRSGFFLSIVALIIVGVVVNAVSRRPPEVAASYPQEPGVGRTGSASMQVDLVSGGKGIHASGALEAEQACRRLGFASEDCDHVGLPTRDRPTVDTPTERRRRCDGIPPATRAAAAECSDFPSRLGALPPVAPERRE